MRYEFEGTGPTVHPDAHVTPEATLVGDVTVDADASVWPGSVLRGDFGPARIGRGSHVEDNCTVHMADVGEDVLVGHNVVLDARAEIGDRGLVSNNATVNSDVTIGERCVVASGAVVPDGTEVPPESFVRGVPATAEPLAETSLDVDRVLGTYAADAYGELVERYDDLFE